MIQTRATLEEATTRRGAEHITDTEAVRLRRQGQGRQETGLRNTPSHVQPGGEREGGSTFCPEEEPVLGPRTEEGATGHRTGQGGGGPLPGTAASFCKRQRATLQANKGRGLNYSQSCPVTERPGLEGSPPRAPSPRSPESLCIAHCPLGSTRPLPCCPFGHCPLATRSVPITPASSSPSSSLLLRTSVGSLVWPSNLIPSGQAASGLTSPPLAQPV